MFRTILMISTEHCFMECHSSKRIRKIFGMQIFLKGYLIFFLLTLEIDIMDMCDLIWTIIPAWAWKISIPETTLVIFLLEPCYFEEDIIEDIIWCLPLSVQLQNPIPSVSPDQKSEMVWVERDIRDHLVPNSLHGQGHHPLNQVCRSLRNTGR